MKYKKKSQKTFFGKKTQRLLLLALCIGLPIGTWAWWQKSREDFVTLDVTDAPLGEVIDVFSHQTGRTILLANDSPPPAPETRGTTNSRDRRSEEAEIPPAERKVTVHFQHTPLDHALGEVSNQARMRLGKYIVVASNRDSLTHLQDDLKKGETSDDWNSLIFETIKMRGSGMGGRGWQGAADSNDLITYEVNDKKIADVLYELAEKNRGIFVADNHVEGNVSLKVKDGSVDDIVRQSAAQVHARAEKFYVLRVFGRGREGPGGGSEMFANEEKEFKKRIAAMSPSERLKGEELIKQANQKREAMRNMTPEERAAMIAKMANDPAIRERAYQRAMSRLLESTPEERVDRDQKRAARQAQAQSQGQGPGPRQNRGGRGG